jgi:hypothetical protein
MERCWKGLSKAQRIPESPLQGKEVQNLWITAGEQALRSHLKAVVGQHHSHWYLAVITDIDLMDSWLHHVPDYDMLDVDVLDKRQKGRPTDRYTALVDLIEPPELLVIRLGIKITRNVAAPEVLLETLKHRQHKDKFTWVVDEPGKPFEEGHISWSPQIREFLSDWDRLTISDNGTGIVQASRPINGYQPVPQASSDQKETTSLLGDLPKPKKEKRGKK